MDETQTQEDREIELLEKLISEIVADPEIRAEMEKIQPIDYEMKNIFP